MSIHSLSTENKAKLTQLIDEGSSVLQEIEDLKGGLKDTVTAIAEEMDIKPSLITKAINIAHKRKLEDIQQDFSDVEAILTATGRGK